MQSKLRQLIITALKRNELTAPLDIYVQLNRGHEVTLSGYAPNATSLYEAIATIESVSPYLRVINHVEVELEVENEELADLVAVF